MRDRYEEQTPSRNTHSTIEQQSTCMYIFKSRGMFLGGRLYQTLYYCNKKLHLQLILMKPLIDLHWLAYRQLIFPFAGEFGTGGACCKMSYDVVDPGPRILWFCALKTRFYSGTETLFVANHISALRFAITSSCVIYISFLSFLKISVSFSEFVLVQTSVVIQKRNLFQKKRKIVLPISVRSILEKALQLEFNYEYQMRHWLRV